MSGKTVLDLNQPQDNLRAFIKTRASLEPEEVFFGWTGGVFSYVPDQRGRHLFCFAGFNVARAVQVEGGYDLLTREAAFYQDVEGGQILQRWQNPFTGQTQPVVHVWNDPVNQKLRHEWKGQGLTRPYTDLGNGDICWPIDVFLSYPSPLPQDEYPLYSQSDTYQGGELFQFYVRREDLEDESLSSAPCLISWARIGPWLPWMEMADRPGHLVYHCRGKKLPGGAADLPAQIREYVEVTQPKFLSAPDAFTGPNETSWSYFKKWLAERQATE
jgi:hypothetical protein